MAMLVDTCVLLRAFDRASAEYGPIRRSLRKAIDRQESLVITIQNAAEFWNVTTRPTDRNGQGLSTERAMRRLAIIERACNVVSEDASSYQAWKRMVEELGVSGVAVHDARLAAIMVAANIPQILTLNARDFRRYEQMGVNVVTPEMYLRSA
ncbi:tRNA(fMet)-specific endonuclease VapC [Pirellulimonas nuda]|uniref:tRNA(fMet)-specific endonuclease VapC n=1 Tax=Pirellulimonas nuda TaxID=2528009 RepID=A0A518D685_9BACT|nr:type II toxin-antitoxin system VapC family toxin [Pirellulimonas nuda]QDU86986.1 tRNA(fMet)-specific endonuclease VapC [Pirellulimonas nuda]